MSESIRRLAKAQDSYVLHISTPDDKHYRKLISRADFEAAISPEGVAEHVTKFFVRKLVDDLKFKDILKGKGWNP